MKAIGSLILLVSVGFVISGCVALTGPGARKVSIDDVPIFDRYYLTNLKQSTSADIISAISDDGSEFMSQSESVVAFWSEQKKGYVTWFNMVAFDENDLSAVRKYCMVFDEKAFNNIWFLFPVQRMRFEAAAVLQQDILSQSYASENQRRIAVLRNILTKFNDDFAQVTADSRVLSGSNMMIRQTLNGILNQLDASPALAANLDDLAGMEFDQMNLDKGRVRMLIEGDIVKLKIKIGSSVKDFEEDPDVLGM